MSSLGVRVSVLLLGDEAVVSWPGAQGVLGLWGLGCRVKGLGLWGLGLGLWA